MVVWGHTGFMIILVKILVISLSLKQKFNTKSSTEGELVGSQNGLGVVLFINHFVEDQGYTV